jgi:branched-subunit amino acid aminotransferase/4-amino-4-deoxychorismate lyase
MTLTPADLVLIDGETGDGRIPVFDDGLLRGDGCFEAIRSYRGRPFALEQHLTRLSASASALAISLRPIALIARWVEEVAASGGDCIVRVVVTRGSTVPGHHRPPRCIVMSHPLPAHKAELSLLAVPAPWHPAGRAWELSGVKTISYAPNQAATRLAGEAGFDDALLLSDAGTILEGPTFSFAWIVGGVLETAGIDLGILDSITRQLVLADSAAIGLKVKEGRFDIGRLINASEAMAMSTVKQVVPVTAVGEWTFPIGVVASTLNDALLQRAQATAPQITIGR